MRLIVLLDVDGIVGDFDSAFLKAYKKITGIHLDGTIINRYDVMSCLPASKKTKKKVWALTEKRGWCKSIKPYKGAVEAVKKLMKKHDVFFVTAPAFRNETWTHEREIWLRKHFGEDVQTIHTKHKYRVHGDVLLDDKVENLVEWEKHNKGLAIIWDKLYNKEYKGLRIKSWKEMSDILETKAM